ncbi:hypothetical protein [Nocardioides euryhalodurans]|uniref:Uncharacterized protein n=1 Tax=Nocardioides euryhalodurans TaxID=2518370 RepID=A0A4P7GH58_9ACTN|nr:hypothetical protein [Nocardioides euryhalodurans]QBR90989.1 hypothetical protein EXE57_00925 [Nocardioides euryhalodurans]
MLLTALLGVALAPFPQQTASASCAAPYLEAVGRQVLERGAAVTVGGRSFVDGCRDTMTCSTGPGCGSCSYDDLPVRPLEDVVLRLVQGDRSWELAVADADTAANDRLGWVTWVFELPAGVRPGAARLVAEDAQPVRIRIR